jgi:hypothetical protein
VLEPAWARGDSDLLERLAANMLSNATRHNVVASWIEFVTRTECGRADLTAIANAHDATLTAQTRSGGGLGIDVAFPALS